MRPCNGGCVLTECNKVQAQNISHREFKLRTIHRAAESREVSFRGETCVMSQHSLSHWANNRIIYNTGAWYLYIEVRASYTSTNLYMPKYTHT